MKYLEGAYPPKTKGEEETRQPSPVLRMEPRKTQMVTASLRKGVMSPLFTSVCFLLFRMKQCVLL